MIILRAWLHLLASLDNQPAHVCTFRINVGTRHNNLKQIGGNLITEITFSVTKLIASRVHSELNDSVDQGLQF